MGPGDLVGLLLALSFPTILMLYVLRRFFALREKRLDIEALNAAEKAAQYVAHSREIEERLAVLERIATDQPGALAREIDALAIANQAQPKKDPA